MSMVTWFFVFIILGFGFFAGIYFRKAYSNDSRINPLLLENIPNIFTTLGIFGTFVGIFFGLLKFDVYNIDGSIPQLLEGLKTAFITSILGIFGSMISARFIEHWLNKKDNQAGVNDEIGLLKSLNSNFSSFKENQHQQMDALLNSILGDADGSLGTQLTKLRSTIRDSFSEQGQLLQTIQSNLGDDSETSLLTQLQRLREEQFEIARENKTMISSINDVLIDSREYIGKKFEEFGELLERSNTEALVKAIENVIGGFNERLNELIERLVKENFEELNASVQRLNEWQQKNKEQVEQLISQFEQVAENLSVSSETLEKVSRSTTQLVDDEGRLTRLIKELEDVMVENTMFKDSVAKLTDSSEKMNQSTVNLQNWMETQSDLAEKIEQLVINLKEIEKLREKSGEFWSDIREQFSKGIEVIEEGNEALVKKVNTMDDAFYDRMNSVFEGLDKVLQNMVMNYADRLNRIINPN
ncbi:MAG: MotA/TolQ/ExbB proton channel family protein [Calditrichia bacterium]